VPLVEGRSVNKSFTVSIHSRRRAPNFSSEVWWRNASGIGKCQRLLVTLDVNSRLRNETTNHW
jgi:hypothetical protein